MPGALEEPATVKLRTTLQLASFFPIFLTALFVLHLLSLHFAIEQAGGKTASQAVAGAIFMAVFSLIVGSLFYRAGQKLVTQVGALEGMADRVKHGDLKSTTDTPEGKGEVAEVAQVFGQMLGELRGYVDLIQSHEKLQGEHNAALATIQTLRDSSIEISGLLERLRRAELETIQQLLATNPFILAWLPLDAQRKALDAGPSGVLAASIPDRVRKVFVALASDGDDAQHTLTPIQDALDDAIALCDWKWGRSRADSAKITVALDLPSNTSGEVEAGRGTLVQAFAAILLNAADAMPTGGEISINVDSDSSGSAGFAIVDTGSGMIDSVQTRCMKPFFSTKEHHLGIGLPLASRMVFRAGGRMGIVSTPGEGTAVHLSFPRYTAGKRGTGAAAPAQKPLKVLLVEDDDAVRKMLAGMLSRDKHVVQAAADGAAAVLILRREEFDLVVTDRAMPVMSGDELAVVVKVRYPATRVVLATAHGEELTRRNQLPDGVDILLPKPILRDDLRVAIARAMETARPEAPHPEAT